MGKDIMDAAAALADHQESFQGKQQACDNTSSVIYHASEDIPSTGKVIEDISIDFISNKEENYTPSKSTKEKNSGLLRDTTKLSEIPGQVQDTREIERSSEDVLRQMKGNVEIGDQFLGEEAANNRNNCSDQATNTMVIRSVALGHKGKIVL